MVAPIQPGNPSSRLVERQLSQNELAHRAGITAAVVCRAEAGKGWSPRRETVLLLAEALGLGVADTTRLVIAAGYWPAWVPERVVERVVEAAESLSYVEAAGMARP